MVFSSLPFLYLFLPVVLIECRILPDRCRNAVLLLANLFFYAYGEPVYILLMLASIVVNYAFGRALGHCSARRGRQVLLWLSVAVNLLGLLVFKYAGLLTGTVNYFFPAVPVLSLRLPIGISFYTFQAMSYVIDVYREECDVENSLVTFAAYISLFPQLIAGPIVRYTDVREQLQQPGRKSSLPGVRLFVIGLSKKVLLANQLGMLWESVSADPAAAGTLGVWLGVAAYSLQLYFDFSGYSDMARGLGAFLGFDFCINFDYPYISRSITEFWRRWHISLSTWFRDYVYFPLGGSRCSLPRMCLNLLITWMLTGIWHGAGWNFLFWGFYHGVLLIVEKLFLGRYLQKLPVVIQRIYTLLIVMIGWLFFASESFTAAWDCLRVMLHPVAGTVPGGLLSWLPLGLAACVASTPAGARLWNRWKDPAGIREAVLCLLAMILCTACLVSESYNPFLYFRF